MAKLSYTNIFARDIEALSGFYRTVFGFQEIPAIRSPIFVGLDAGGTCIGFNAQDAYGLLNLGDQANPTGVKFLLNIDVDSVADVDRMVPVAVSAGAVLIKPPYKTYYNWYQAVLFDPEQNVFRINHMLQGD
jgi:predicted enzyme related to lactoylglutathione lyase